MSEFEQGMNEIMGGRNKDQKVQEKTGELMLKLANRNREDIQEQKMDRWKSHLLIQDDEQDQAAVQENVDQLSSSSGSESGGEEDESMDDI